MISVAASINDTLSQCTYRCVVLPDIAAVTSGWAAFCLNAPTGAWCSLTGRPQARTVAGVRCQPDGDWRALSPGAYGRGRPSQCTYRCVVLPDICSLRSLHLSAQCLNAPTGAWCSLTRRGAPRPAPAFRLNAPTGAWCSLTDLAIGTSSLTLCLNAPTGAWCSLTEREEDIAYIEKGLNAPTGAWCSLTGVIEWRRRKAAEVSMHLQVRGAP